MGVTSISWTDRTRNLLYGCRKVDVDLATGACANCLPPGHVILGDNKNIENLVRNDRVIGSIGLSSVAGSFGKAFSGDLVRIKGSGLLPFSVTPEHRILSIRKRAQMKNHAVDFTGLKPSWRPAESLLPKNRSNLEEADYLVVPRLQGSFSTCSIDISSYAKGRHGIETAIAKGVPTIFPLTKDSAWLIGLFVAEGSSGESVVFSLNKNEIDLADRIERIGNGLGYSVSSHESRTSLVVVLSSRMLARAFRDWCGHEASHKKFPDFLLLHNDLSLVQAAIDGYVAGDGCIIPAEVPYISISTTSVVLAMQCQLAYARLGKGSSIQIDATERAYVEGRKVNALPFYLINIHQKSLWRSIGQNWYVPIRQVSRVTYDGMVYDIETGTHDFLVSNAVVSNCYIFRDLPRWGYDPNKLTYLSLENAVKDLKKWSSDPKVRKIFLNNFSDTWHEDIPFETIDLWVEKLIEGFPNFEFQLLTKRIGRAMLYWKKRGYVPRNVWMGCTIGARNRLWRLDQLRQIPAKIRWVSFEPLLEDLGDFSFEGMQWGVVGGESGAHPRPMRQEWAENVIRVIKRDGGAAFFKQLGGQGFDEAGGCILNGREIKEFPDYQEAPMIWA